MKYNREIKESPTGVKTSKYTGDNLPEGFVYECSPYNLQERLGEKAMEEKIDNYVKRKKKEADTKII
jgi:hypothetical protein